MNFSNLKYDEIKKYLEENKENDFDYIIQSLKSDSRKSVQKLGYTLEKKQERRMQEVNRINMMYDFDREFGVDITIAGTDEVGRGPLAGPIVAAAVILNLKSSGIKDLIWGINDSKKLTENKRQVIQKAIAEKAIEYNIYEIENNIIDERGISWCNNEVMKQACLGLKTKIDLILSDGYNINNISYKNFSVIKGDTKSASIACASIIAKVYRDNIMKKYAEIYPQYDFENNVGYGTKKHIDAIKKFGISKIHRKSFLKNIL